MCFFYCIATVLDWDSLSAETEMTWTHCHNDSLKTNVTMDRIIYFLSFLILKKKDVHMKLICL